MSEKLNIVKRVSISPGNQKMGAIPSVSLPPVKTCPAGCPCAAKCYAAKLCRIYPSVRNAYDNNLAILAADPVSYWEQVKAAAAVTKFFRYHVSGDIPNRAYFENMVELARDLKNTQFLCFTKKYDIVNNYIDTVVSMGGETLPENLHVIFSEWGNGWTVDNPHNLPTSAVIFRGTEPRDNWKVCGGNCAECACRGCGCWELKNGETIAFYEH